MRLLRRYLTFDLNDPTLTTAARGKVVVKEGFNRPTPDDSSRPILANAGVDDEGDMFESEKIQNKMLTGEQTAEVT